MHQPGAKLHISAFTQDVGCTVLAAGVRRRTGGMLHMHKSCLSSVPVARQLKRYQGGRYIFQLQTWMQMIYLSSC